LLSTSLHAGVDITVIALWLGHESVTTTQIYLQADMALKQQALDRTTPPASAPAATGLPTSSSPSSKPCDYADILHPVTAAGLRRHTWYRHNDGVGLMSVMPISA
jgi:hypothetical protein